MSRWIVAVAGLVAVTLVATGAVPAPIVFGPLVGVAIWKMGMATFGSLRRGATHVPDGTPPQPVDPRVEQVTYHCEGCGTELLLLVRGTPMAPRHCGERMAEHREIAWSEPN